MSPRPDPVDRDFQRFCRSGDPDALGRVFDAVAGQLLHLALWLCGNRADAEDVLQRTFVQAIELRDRYEGGRSAVAWLLGLLGNQAKKQRRERAPRAVPASSHAVRDPIVDAAAAELEAAVETVRSRCGDAYREVLRLHLQEGRSAHEIAGILRRPAGTVRTQLMRALQELRRRLPSGFVVGMAPAWFATNGAPVSAVLREMVIAAARAAGPARVGGLVAQVQSSTTASLLPKSLLAIAAGLLTALAFLSHGLAGPTPSGYVRIDSRGELMRTETASVTSTADLGAAGTAERLTAPAPAGQATLFVRAIWSDTGERAVGQVIQCLIDDHPLRRQSATTGVDGCCTFDRQAGVCALSGLGFAAQDLVLEPGERRTVDLSISRGMRLTGCVVDQAGARVAAADIVASNLGMSQPTRVVATTDAAGRFAVDVRIGTGIHAQKAGHAPSLHRRIEGKVGEVVERTFALRGVGGAVEGVVRDRSGAGVPQAEIVVGSLWPTSSAEHDGVFASEPPAVPVLANNEGRFRVDGLAPGMHAVRGWAIGCAPWYGQAEVSPDAASTMVIVLAPGAVVTGLVRDGEGRAVPGAFCQLRAAEERDERLSFWTDAAGRFAVDSLSAGSFAAEVHRGALGSCAASLSLTAGAVTEWNPVLDVGRCVHGRVVDATGLPIAKATVGWERNDVREPWTHTDDDGRFVLTNLPASVRVVVYGEAWFRLAEQTIEAPRDDVLLTITAENSPTASMRGRVVDELGQPLRCHVDLSLGRETHSIRLATDAEGNFVQADLPSGDYALYVVCEGHARLPWRVVTLPRDANVDVGTFALTSSCSLTVRVTDLDGHALTSGWLAVLTHDGLDAGHADVRDGLAEVAGLRPGTYRIEADGDRQQGQAEAVVVEGERSETTMRLGETIVLCKVRCTAPYAMPPETKADVEVDQGAGESPLRCVVPVSDEYFDGANMRLPVGRHRFTAHCGKTLVGEVHVVVAARNGPESPVLVTIPLRAGDGR